MRESLCAFAQLPLHFLFKGGKGQQLALARAPCRRYTKLCSSGKDLNLLQRVNQLVDRPPAEQQPAKVDEGLGEVLTVVICEKGLCPLLMCSTPFFRHAAFVGRVNDALWLPADDPSV